jgi:hypothetical protein
VNIEVNGKQYDSWDDVPEDIRKLVQGTGALPDTDHDGVPDLFENTAALPSGSTTIRSTTVTTGGQTYNSIDEVPPDIRAALQSAGLLGGPQPSGPQPSGPQPSGVLLNGVPVEAAGKVERKRWWRRG